MSNEPDYDAIVIGAGVAGIYQLHRLLQEGLTTTVLEAAGGLGGTWYSNRYPGCRFDSESYTYGFSFSKELLDEWSWSERFSSQPENLRYLEFVAEKFDLRRHMQFNCRVDRAVFQEEDDVWRVYVGDGRELTCRVLITAVGQLSVPTLPEVEGLETFRGRAFHTYDWPHEGLEIDGKRVAVVGTGATGVQVISAIADRVAELYVFQRRPNWCAPLNNSAISPAEMEEIRSRYDAIFATCARTPGGFIHEPDRRPFHDVPREERVALWEKLYDEPGFGIWLQNFRDIFIDEDANAEFSEFIAEKIRGRVDDPRLAEKLIPKDHGFGVQRVPLETNYYEAYNRNNVHLVDLQETPIERITPSGIRTTERQYDVDVIVFATGFDAITGAYDRIEFVGVDGQRLRDKWATGPVTFLGMLVHGFPNLLTVAGPQSASGSVNYPRSIETGVEWVTELVRHMRSQRWTRVEATEGAELEWGVHVRELFDRMLLRKSRGWFTGYNSNVPGHENLVRYLVYVGGAPKFRATITDIADGGYRGLEFR